MLLLVRITFTPQLLLLPLTVMLKPFEDPLLLLLSIIILQLMLPHHLPPFNYLLLHFIFFSASAFISTLSLLVLIYNLSRLSDDH
jgi:hypothetical protein